MNMKTIVITGGSDGLGKALAERFAPNGRVIILARNEVAMRKVSQETGCKYYTY